MQEYTLVDVEIPKVPFTDTNGNHWITAVFEGYGEPVKWVIKDPKTAIVGEKYYGEIKDWTSAKGKTMPRFFRKPRPDNDTSPGQSHTGTTAGYQKKEWQPRDDDRIVAQWAIGQATQIAIATRKTIDLKSSPLDEIETWAKELFAMVDRVKQGTPTAKEDRDEDAEMRRLAAMGEEINLDDIPY